MSDQPTKIETDGPAIIEVEHPEPAIIDTDAEGQPTAQPETEPAPEQPEPVPGQQTIAEALAAKVELPAANAEEADR